MKTSCVIVEDQLMFLQLLTKILKAIPALEVLATAQKVASAISACETHRPDLLLLDLNLDGQSGIPVARALIKARPDAKIVILSGEASMFICPPSLIQHVHAVVDKTRAYEELLLLIETLLAQNGTQPDENIDPRHALSAREYEIFQLIGRGHLSKEIADRLSITTSTVQSHRKMIALKLKTVGPELTLRAINHQAIHQI